MSDLESLATLMSNRAEHWFRESARLLPFDADVHRVTAAAHALGDFIMGCHAEDPHVRPVRSGQSIRDEVCVYLVRGRRRLEVSVDSPLHGLADRMLERKGLGHRKFDLVNYLSCTWGDNRWAKRLTDDVRRVAAGAPRRDAAAEERARLEAARRKQARASLARAVERAVAAGMTLEEMYDLVGVAVVRPVMED